MKHKPLQGNQFFFATAPLPCPYLEGQVERRVVTELIGREAEHLHDTLSMAGYRRSHSIAYAPACPGCDACTAVRINTKDFKLSKSQRRVWNTNNDLVARETGATATQEQFDLFAKYLNHRHADGDMSKMDEFDYRALVEDTPVETHVIEFRNQDNELIGCCLTDRVKDGLSAVYSFFDCEQEKRSLGTYMVLWLVNRARELDLPHIYLGYWVKDCQKMAYKINFQPLEAYRNNRWVSLSTDGDLDL